MGEDIIDRLKREIIDACRHIVQVGVISPSLHGNFSARVPGTETFLLTGGGSIANLKPEDIALFHLDGTLKSGAIRASNAEVIDMHSIVYQLRPDVGAVVHTHSPKATVYAVANKSIPVIYEPMIRFGMEDGVPVAAYAPRGSGESVKNIAEAIKSHVRIGAVLLGNHGVLAFGANADRAVHSNILIEECAALGLEAETLGGAVVISAEMVAKATQRQAEFAAGGTRRA